MKQAQRALIVFFALVFSQLAASAGWKEIRTSPSGKSGWQYVVCQGGSGWNTCELDLNIVLTAAPKQLVAVGEQATIYATVTDAYNNPVEAGVRIGWVTTDGAVSATESRTDANGVATIVLTSSHSLGGATVTANALDYGGAGSLFVPYIDKWVAYPSTYTAWANYGAYYSCTAWTPDTSTVAAGTWFTQSAWCWQQQQQWRQDRLQSVVTGAVINNGPPVPLYQTISIAISQMNVGTKVVAPVCEYIGPRNDGTIPPNRTYWSSIDPAGDLGLSLNGVSIVSFPNVAHNGERWPGSYVYNGYVYTVGNFREMKLQGRNFELYFFEACGAPL
ncbi:Ig-like domain-containing protein [Pseudomonas baetica]|uniref:Ig-like domain-containing protein n=1 Tax=Pseudomonas baetica TaxID=674054 RepID=UPI002405D631|nr:Ig-like domain-containing protein [Pseudomonas baetica]MDF9779307.1 hypothetical protein [Pseudomonas baetica]